jgi:hypothetical protein
VLLAESAFTISKDGKPAGPFTRSDLMRKLKSGDLAFTDYLWSDDDSDWRMLADFFRADFPPPKDPPPGKKKSESLKEFDGETFTQDIGISNEPIWFLFKDNTKFGPYRYLEIVRLLQTNACAQEDFVWKPGFDDWVRLNQTPEFTEKVLKKLTHMKNFAVEKVFIHRRFPRVPYDSEVILHDEKRVVFGAARSLSEGGAFLEVAKPTHVKGDRIKIHFTPGELTVPFNCIAEVTQVSKGEPRGYNVKFIYLEEEDRKRIAKFAEKASKA